MTSIAQGGTQAVAISGSSYPAGGHDWDILDSTSTVIANTGTPAGWTVTGLNPATVHVPLTAALGTYTVRVAPVPSGH